MLNAIEVIKHHFIADEIYLKEMIIKDGYEVVSHKHKFDHASFLVSGCVIVEADGIQSTHYAPDTIMIKAGVAHSVTAVNGDAKWYCGHITDCTDETKVDEVLIEKAPEHQNMCKLNLTFDVDLALEELRRHPELWNQYTMRTTMFENSPHSSVDDIWLRYRSWSEFDADSPTHFADKHDSVWYMAIKQLPSVRGIIEKIMLTLPKGTELGGALITRINPGCEVKPHEDHGWHAEYYRDKFLVLLQSAPDQSFNFYNESHTGLAGEVFEFKNQAKHWVINDSNTPRISLIFACRKP